MDMSTLLLLQSLPLEVKIAKTKLRIREAINYFGAEGLYVSFSGGKDSTVLHYLVKEVEEELWGEQRIPRVFCDTGLEYPELKLHARKIATDIIRPEIPYNQVLTKYGYPIFSKSTSMTIRKLTTQNLSPRYRNKLLYGDERGNMGRLASKYHYALDADFRISEKCCDVMKKRPFKIYEKKTDRIAIVGVMAEESQNRKIRYVKDGGCNAFNCNRPQSRPLGFWREQDILKYIYINKIEIAPIYGKVVEESRCVDLFTTETIYRTTGERRTGCIFCPYGVHLEKEGNRFERLKETHPKLYNYCMNGGKYDDEGKWVPTNEGLGYKKVLNYVGVPIAE